MITSPHLLQWHLRVSTEPCAPRVHPKSLFTEGLWVCLMTDTAAAFNQPSLIFTPLISMKTFMTQGHPTLRLAITLEEVNSDSHYANTEIQHSTLNFHSINNTLSSVYFIIEIRQVLHPSKTGSCHLQTNALHAVDTVCTYYRALAKLTTVCFRMHFLSAS